MSTASKQYYWEELERIKAAAKEVPAGQDEITRDMIAFICSLNFHCLMIIIKEFTDRKATLTSMNSRSINYFIFGFFDLISLLVNRKGLRLLFDEARNGSDDALYQLIQVDKTAFDHEWLRTRINIAVCSGDHVFFKKLARALRTDPFRLAQGHN